LSPLMVISAGLNVPCSYICRKYINHINLLYFPHSPPPLSVFPLVWPVWQVLHSFGVFSLFIEIFALIFYLSMYCA
jgi:hypothetical protein